MAHDLVVRVVRQRAARVGGPRWGLRRRRVALALALVVSVLWCLLGAPSSLGAAESQAGAAVELDVVAGLGGVVGSAPVVPVRVEITSPRAREADVEVEWEAGARTYRVELPAGGRTQLDVAVPTPVPGQAFSVDVVVRDGEELARATERVEPEPDVTVVGVGSSLVRAGAPERTPTVAGIQQARLVELDEDTMSRPGALASMSGIVLAAADVDELDDAGRAALRTWVWQGGDLAVDVAASEQLPVVDLPSTGERTMAGAGWVRLTGGLAAAGSWDRVVEPSVDRVLLQSDQMGGFSSVDDWEFLGLIRISFLPVWIVAVSVFGTALLAGPLLFVLLRTRARRRVMWLAAPALSIGVAALLLVLGQGVFARAEAQAKGAVWSTPWSTSGDVVSGLKGRTALSLDDGVEVTGSSPDAIVEDTGDGAIAVVDLPRNGFGAIGLSPVVVDPGAMIEVTAVPGEGTTADVTVTNRSSGTFTGVSVSGAGRSRPFDDVGPGESRTLPFEMSEDVPPFGPMFPETFDDVVQGPVVDEFGGPEMFFDPSFDVGFVGWTQVAAPASRGLVMIRGVLEADIDAFGERSTADLSVRAIAPVTATEPSSAALRIETVGAPPSDATIAPADGAATTTTAITGQGAEPQLQPATGYVRMSAPAGRSASPCAVHTMVQRLERWDGTGWVPLEKVGVPVLDPRLVEPNEVQEWAMPELAAGQQLLLRVAVAFPSPLPLMFDCAGPWA